MNPNNIVNEPIQELLDAQSHVWNHTFSFLNSMALKCAIELGIPDAIHKHGKSMTLSELAITLSLHPNKAPSLSRLMRLLVHSNFFSKSIMLSNGEEVFDLTINSQLLLKDHPQTLAPFALMMLDPILIEPAYHFSSWFRNEDGSAFHIAHGKNLWEHAACVPTLNKRFSEAMASDAQFISSLLLANNEFKGLIMGLDSLVDVGGGNGTMAKAIAEAFQGLECIVYDLPHVVHGLERYGNGRNLTYWILHDWSDDHCIKILQRCKEAIPSKDQGGKIIIIDMVVKIKNGISNNYCISQLLFDMQMMSTTLGGKERTEEEWNKLFISAGLSDYKISPILGSRSVIVVYPF
ncbi:Trans-resveratrol di-O-methyltransferase [Bienertia sinuspersici]